MNYQNFISPSSVFYFDTDDYILKLVILIQSLLYSKFKKNDYKKIDELICKILHVKDEYPYEPQQSITEGEKSKYIHNLDNQYKELKFHKNEKTCIDLLLRSYTFITDNELEEDLDSDFPKIQGSWERNFIHIRNKVFEEILSFF